MVAAQCSLVGSRSLAVALGLFSQCAPYMLSDTRGYAVYWGSLCMVSEDGGGSLAGAALELSCPETQRRFLDTPACSGSAQSLHAEGSDSPSLHLPLPWCPSV